MRLDIKEEKLEQENELNVLNVKKQELLEAVDSTVHKFNEPRSPRRWSW